MVLFSEAVFEGSFRRPSFRGERRIVARILRESYGAGRQQHTFTLEVLASDGIEPVSVGATLRRKGRNLYRNGLLREMSVDEGAREQRLEEKHQRGDRARAVREARGAEGAEW